MPWPSAVWPVSMLAWAVQVTAGSTSRNGRCQPAWARACSRGACGSRRVVRPTVLTRIRGCMRGILLQAHRLQPVGLPGSQVQLDDVLVVQDVFAAYGLAVEDAGAPDAGGL